MANTNPTFYIPDHHTPRRTDTELVVLQKILGATIDGGGGSGGTNNLSGSGSPVGVEVPDYVGQTYTDTDGGFWASTGLTNADWMQVA